MEVKIDRRGRGHYIFTTTSKPISTTSPVLRNVNERDKLQGRIRGHLYNILERR